MRIDVRNGTTDNCTATINGTLLNFTCPFSGPRDTSPSAVWVCGGRAYHHLPERGWAGCCYPALVWLSEKGMDLGPFASDEWVTAGDWDWEPDKKGTEEGYVYDPKGHTRDKTSPQHTSPPQTRDKTSPQQTHDKTRDKTSPQQTRDKTSPQHTSPQQTRDKTSPQQTREAKYLK
ncbi:hypothetical protein G5714_004015 [Onychostoma macrolepis]|uniref:Uncharacterized protein n=1 Tax=Onychostoma macrolepis TaxID=369639 RepID=A0A7J6DB20_9TELE|nr:hypothetical protein G5714_004015 [Onychostoma macrolepis]